MSAGFFTRRASGLLLGTVLALLLLLALAVPAAYFSLNYGARAAALQTKAEVKAELVTQLISRSPQLWRYEEIRLLALIQRMPLELEDEHAVVYAGDGSVVVESRHELAPPLLVRSVPLFDAGQPAGRIEMRGSLRQLWAETAVVALAALLVAGGVMAVLHHLRRANRRIAAQMRDAQERASVTLHSIGDAVLTTDAQARIDYMNPVAERLLQWTLDEARERPLAEVCSLVDERSMQPMPTLVPRAIAEGLFCPFTGRDVALLRRDGSSIAIEDSAAPIRDGEGRIVGSVMVFRDVTATRRMAQRISWAATHDALTGLANRREFETRLDQALKAGGDSGRPLVVACMDLDCFKIVNDSCGHAAGDLLLKQVAELLRARLRESDTLARVGGDEFSLLLDGCSMERARLIAADLVAAVHQHRFVWEGRAFTIGVSIGLAAAETELQSRNELLACADTACYTAKEQGRNRVCVFQSGDADMQQRRAAVGWAARLQSALEEGRFLLHYQPYLPLGQTQAGDGLHIEVLLRLREADGTLVLPTAFLPAAERYNIMPAIDRWVIGTVLARYRSLEQSLGAAPLTCSINLSATSINAEGTLDFIREQLERHQLPAGAICLEITETAAIHNLRAATAFMQAGRAMGLRFALDDFGVGSSSLAYLKTLPVDYLKIDGSFTRNIATDPIDRAMAETINRVGHIMGLRTVGEYAESEAVLGELRQLGVDFAQGFAYREPQPLPPLAPLSPDERDRLS
ncbi:MAG: GGDEF domain-containing protein [Methylibium sp.]|nr:GGDEF domain-containing protein [Methylibium sp.]